MPEVVFLREPWLVLDEECGIQSALGEERCALLLGSKSPSPETSWLIHEAIPVENEDHRSDRFSMNPEAVYHVLSLNDRWSKLIGFFHTHPGVGAVEPSSRDREFMRLWPAPYLWVIGGRGKSGPVIRAYTFSEEEEITRIRVRPY
jgi:proteasome lid subunit RPN8/RPN11